MLWREDKGRRLMARNRRYEAALNHDNPRSPTFYPTPLMDWERIREAKRLCMKCSFYNQLMNGCNKGWMPTDCRLEEELRKGWSVSRNVDNYYLVRDSELRSD